VSAAQQSHSARCGVHLVCPRCVVCARRASRHVTVDSRISRATVDLAWSRSMTGMNVERGQRIEVAS
jgi:hypothetical protein